MTDLCLGPSPGLSRLYYQLDSTYLRRRTHILPLLKGTDQPCESRPGPWPRPSGQAGSPGRALALLLSQQPARPAGQAQLCIQHCAAAGQKKKKQSPGLMGLLITKIITGREAELNAELAQATCKGQSRGRGAWGSRGHRGAIVCSGEGESLGDHHHKAPQISVRTREAPKARGVGVRGHAAPAQLWADTALL